MLAPTGDAGIDAVREIVYTRRQTIGEKESSMKYVCKVCGYVYDPAEHDGVAFADLPADWVCPICGVGKDEFEPQN